MPEAKWGYEEGGGSGFSDLGCKRMRGKSALTFWPEGGKESGGGKIEPLYLRTRRSLLELTKERNSAEYATMYNVFCVFIPKLTSQL